MSSLQFPGKDLFGVSRTHGNRLSFAALLALTLASALTGAVVALVVQRFAQRHQLIEVLPSPTPIRPLQHRAETTPGGPAPPVIESDAVSPLAAVAANLTPQRAAELARLVAEDDDVVAGDGSVNCPVDFPIKGNGRSGIYHWPGAMSYEPTHPTLCFRTTDAADRAGFRAAKR